MTESPQVEVYLIHVVGEHRYHIFGTGDKMRFESGGIYTETSSRLSHGAMDRKMILSMFRML